MEKSKDISLVKDENGNYHLPTALDLYPVCGEPTGVILGGGKEVDKIGRNGAVFTNKPCNDCMNNMKLGIVIIEVKDEQDPPYRTGRMVTITEECAGALFAKLDLKKNRCFYMEETLFSKVFNKALEEKDADK